MASSWRPAARLDTEVMGVAQARASRATTRRSHPCSSVPPVSASGPRLPSTGESDAGDPDGQLANSWLGRLSPDRCGTKGCSICPR